MSIEKRESSKPGPEEGMSLAALNKEIDQYSTDPTIILQIDKDFQDVVRDFSGDPDLELFKIKFETMYNSLKESYENEIRWIKKCKEHNSEIVIYSSKVQMALKMANDDEQQADVFKRELEEKWRKIDELKDKENELKDKIAAGKVELQNLAKQLEKGIDDIDEQNQIILNDKKRIIEDFTKNLHGLYSKLSFLRTQNENLMHDLKQEETLNIKYLNEISNNKENIIKIKSQSEKEEYRKNEMDGQMAVTKQKIDDAKKEQVEKTQLIQENKKKAEAITQQIHAKIKDKEFFHDRLRFSSQNRFAMEKETENQTEAVKVIKDQIELQTVQIAKQIEQIEKLKVVIKKITKEKEEMAKLKSQEIIDKQNHQIEKEKLQTLIESKQVQVNILRRQRDVLKDNIDHKLKERTQHTKHLKKAEDEEHNMDEEIVNLLNKLKKIENQVLGYEAENEKLRKMIAQLQREQEKYGIEASQAHAKYYQTIEEVKIKNNQIAELQKKNTEVEAKLKHQQNLYEAVRSDRNLYSKNLLESQEEIAELTKKYTRMTHQVDQLKEEIKTKDAHLMKQDYEFHKVVEENRKTKLEKDRVKKAIRSTEDVIKNQENHISRLKYIIQEAKTEKQRQEKDYEMVVNERDILGTQLIKRNQELSVLYEKIKLSQSNLAKGEINFREKQIELKSLQKELTNLRNELRATLDQVSCITDLKNEINSLEKDLLNEKNKVKALQDELTNPMNVHRWRKLEATDQENFERILKIQTLQRRLIAKTEEVQEKEALIKEKEKLFMELKNILSRQPGAEIHQQLASYKESLKEKTGQMKKMLGELKNSQDSVDILKFELQRLKGELSNMKQEYFKRRREEDREKEEKSISPDMLHEQNQQLLVSGPRLQPNNFMIGGKSQALAVK